MSTDKFTETINLNSSIQDEIENFESLVNSKSINSRELLVWYRNREKFDISKFFWCNQTQLDKIGLDANEDGLISNKDYKEILVFDDEGKKFHSEMRKASDELRYNPDVKVAEYVIKVKNKKTSKLIYLHYYLEIFERDENGVPIAWGGNGVDVSSNYINSNEKYIIDNIGDSHYNMVTNELCLGTRKASLNQIEARMLLLLVENKNTLVTYEDIMNHLDFPTISSAKEAGKVYVFRLRKKMREIGCTGVRILSSYSKGYSMEIG